MEVEQVSHAPDPKVLDDGALDFVFGAVHSKSSSRSPGGPIKPSALPFPRKWATGATPLRSSFLLGFSGGLSATGSATLSATASATFSSRKIWSVAGVARVAHLAGKGRR